MTSLASGTELLGNLKVTLHLGGMVLRYFSLIFMFLTFLEDILTFLCPALNLVEDFRSLFFLIFCLFIF